jgi:traG family protein
MATGWLAGQVARDFTPTPNDAMNTFEIENSTEFKTSKYFCKTNFDMKKIKSEEAMYEDIPPLYNFGSDREMEVILNRNFISVDSDIINMIKGLYPEGTTVKS